METSVKNMMMLLIYANVLMFSTAGSDIPDIVRYSGFIPWAISCALVWLGE